MMMMIISEYIYIKDVLYLYLNNVLYTNTYLFLNFNLVLRILEFVNE